MRRLSLLVFLCLAAALSMAAYATPYTPLSWQRVVERHANPLFIGQKKNTTWIRDQNRNFIDDDIERRFRPGDRLDVIVDLNHCPIPATLDLLASYGKIRNVGKLVSAVHLNDVKFDDLRRLSERSEVAMIELQQRIVPEIDTASRAVEARTSAFYQGVEQSAEALGLTGAGVNIAFVGEGVDDGPTATNRWLALPAGRFVAGVDVTDATDPQDGTRNPTDAGWRLFANGGLLPGHETTMAMLALGTGNAAFAGNCRFPGIGADCRGIAPSAGIVDVRYCTRAGTPMNPQVHCDSADGARALDWVGTHARAPGFSIHVAVLAYSVCGIDDGTSAIAQQVNYLSAVGVVPVASYPSVGNENTNCRGPMDAQAVPGDRLTKAPAAASYAISVNGSDDKNTIDRADDTIWANNLIGPRSDFNLMAPNLLALKPDLTAAATNLSTAVSGGIGGTSPSAAIVGGLAALILEKVPTMTPDDVKELLRSSADSTRNLNPFDASTAAWQTDLGWGLVNVGAALSLAASRKTNVKFPNCQTPSTSGNGNPCSLASGDPFWLNTQDISTTTQPTANVPTTVQVMVLNDGNFPARVRVHFGAYVFGAGAAQFHDLGTQEVDIPPHMTVPVSIPWTPASSDHQCIQVSLAYGEDSDYSDNLTQRNIEVKPSLFDVSVENRFAVPARFDLVATSTKPGWRCNVHTPSFTLDPFTDCAQKVQIGYDAPVGTPAGSRARCDVAVYATPVGGERRLIGGVSLETYVPIPCRVAGLVVDPFGKPVSGARVSFTRVSKAVSEASTQKSPRVATVESGQRVSTTTSKDGTFVLQLTPDVVQILSVETVHGGGNVTLRPMCGPTPRIVVHPKSIELQPVLPALVTGATVAAGVR